MARQIHANRLSSLLADGQPDATSPPESTPSQGTYSPGVYSPPALPSVPSLADSPAWSECHRNYDAICQQLTAAQSKREQTMQRLRDIERVLSAREPNVIAVAAIANAASEVADMQASIGALDRAIQTLERGRRLGETTLRDLSHVEAARLRRPFAALHAREASKVAELFTAALVAFDDFWRWSESWPGVGIGENFQRPCPDNSFGLLVRVLWEKAGMAWQSAETWSNHR